MSFSSDRGIRHRRRRAGAAIELTPLIDITFQLLIFFLLTATFQDDSSLDVELERAKNEQKSREQAAVTVALSEDGRYEVDGVIVDERELVMRLCKSVEEGKESLHIRADRESRHGRVVRLMDAAKGCGMKKMGFLHRN